MKYIPLMVLLWVTAPSAFAQPSAPAPQDGQFRMHGQVLQDEAKVWGAGPENPNDKQTFVPAPQEEPSHGAVPPNKKPAQPPRR